MKKILLSLVLIVAAFTSHAQVWLGGSVNARLSKDIKAFSIAPDVGYCFPNTPFSVACAIEYEGSFLKGECYSHTLTVSPYFRYDICDIGERFSLFTDLIFDIDALEFSFFDVMFCPGVSFDLTEHWSAEFSIGLLGYEWEKIPDNKPTNSFVLGFETAAPAFGIYYNF